jgi:hypothetical protein
MAPTLCLAGGISTDKTKARREDNLFAAGFPVLMVEAAKYPAIKCLHNVTSYNVVLIPPQIVITMTDLLQFKK